ncbi:hypothetical protein A3A95_00925 [Candidatus Nomurabacteria bacterium RIFCSPLOWO2_01_FULL_39_18]|uniref:Uncharacterized protein n=1 Tax=Candidatus Nomurabacteria bacterium RIFCSPHIGHO2_01_FULL_40_24b TaxID=1801739 RepID=A0A1F6V6Y0_9BACT|nr:MAG: hypothetical protein A2647_02725 [Candidatus Nomurabacteria bacterium RIFCSPHIGHO2_01_FULL_40_24b]OGI89870.1 MAG: hypothetical protein A3A95_00925 [Candidatus Nomurabacteria bacterium RIFCSPLOWO2_01_FULL_39_18]
MSKPDEFLKADNTEKGKEARLAKVLKSQRERELSRVFEKLFPLNQERYMLEFYDFEEWTNFFRKFGETIRILLSLDPFVDNLTLKTECQEVLVLLDGQDRNQGKRYSSLVEKLFQFFIDNQIFPPSKLP